MYSKQFNDYNYCICMLANAKSITYTSEKTNKSGSILR